VASTDLKLPVAQFYHNVKRDVIYPEDITWIRQNIPELDLWNDAQLQELGDDDFGQSQLRMTFQTPLEKEWLLDYATFMFLFKLQPKHIYVWDCEDEIQGIFESYKENLPLEKWKKLAEDRIKEVEQELKNQTVKYVR